MLADSGGHGFAWVQSVARAREGDDFTLDKTDHRDAYLIGKPAVRLDCSRTTHRPGPASS
jgi:hypothetical protein